MIQYDLSFDVFLKDGGWKNIFAGYHR